MPNDGPGPPCRAAAAGRAPHVAALTAGDPHRLASCGGASRTIFAKSFPDLRIGSYTTRPRTQPLSWLLPNRILPYRRRRAARNGRAKENETSTLACSRRWSSKHRRREENVILGSPPWSHLERARYSLWSYFFAGQVFRVTTNISARHSSRSIPPPGSSRAPRFPLGGVPVLELRESRAAELFDALRRVAALESPRRDVLDLDLLNLLALVRRPLVCDLRAIIPPNTWTTAGRHLGPPGCIQAARYGPHSLGKDTQDKIKGV
jgi:hypothetical protein